ncbi:MAG: DUF1566 domain-containing protein, partial [Candidatus Lokiarchaeota archaeon]|nr:DUF1566 domain-containing protein [Candidatus Lokiarchaeota archaeon]
KLDQINIQDRENTILFLDAYDEYRERKVTANDFVELRNLTHNFLKVIITSRTNYFACDEAQPHLSTRYISYFDEMQMRQFFKLHHPFRWRRYWKILNRYQRFLDLSRRVVLLNYLNLDILKSVQTEKNRDGGLNNYQVYSQIVESILPDDRNANKLLPRSQAMYIMSLLGFYIICCGGANKIHYATMGEQLLKLLEQFHLSDQQVTRFLRSEDLMDAYSDLLSEIRTRTFLVRDQPGYYYFAHRSFAEYFAARFILDAVRQEKPLMNLSNITFTTPVVEFILEADEKAFDKMLSLNRSTQLRDIATELSTDEINRIIIGIEHEYYLITIEGDEIVIDFKSGLMWQHGGSSNYMNYENARKWVDELKVKGYAGYCDWRLPTLEEAMNLMALHKNRDNLYIDPIFSTNQDWIWTADPYKGKYRQWVVDFESGCCGWDKLDLYAYVRAVRSGQSSNE